MKSAVVYSKDDCPFCVKAKEILKSEGIEIKEININETMGREEFILFIAPYIGDKRPTVPQIFIDEEYIGGCDDLEDKLSRSSEKIEFDNFSL